MNKKGANNQFLTEYIYHSSMPSQSSLRYVTSFSYSSMAAVVSGGKIETSALSSSLSPASKSLIPLGGALNTTYQLEESSSLE